ncbi:cell division cycle protein 23 homolog [Coccinella septempunctata]|uniref:cell division cycle protein 23 homolog n=1 Tax=Coccinella septempunctata TaxID=41139 RepID=UPI001D07FF7B|nr:cell division cycle protein 23 homolog [Coccinella septempunctata]
MDMDLRSVKIDIIKAIHNCSQRGLYQTVKWLSELNYALNDVKLKDSEIPKYEESEIELEEYLVAKSYFDCKEYDRCAHYLKKCESPKSKFLYYYSSYLSIEKKKMDGMADTNCPPDPKKDDELRNLASQLLKDNVREKMDGYLLYLYGLITKKLDATSIAKDTLQRSVESEPMLWCSWFELGKLVEDFSTLPDHWMKQFFIAHASLEQLRNDEALQMCQSLSNKGFVKSMFLMSQLALCYHNNRELDKAITMFRRILKLDPYRLDNLDIYSNLLYVQEMKTQLADLAHKVVTIDKYRVETCCVIGNYYSLRSDHPKAVLYFKRALKLNPRFLSAWTLMGHEFMEMKNTNAAIQSYRRALEINSKDYRAWYGLGQTYEILKMYFYSLHYYKQAQQLKPNDSRMIIAVGEIYEKLDKIENALKCYFKACSVGDVEGLALIRLSKLYDKLNDTENAAAAFTEYCLREESNKDKAYEEQTDFYNALQYLANYHMNKGQLDDAYTYAYKCLDCDETKEQGKALLKEIAAKRVERDNENKMVESTTRDPSEAVNSSDMNFSDMNMEN